MTKEEANIMDKEKYGAIAGRLNQYRQQCADVTEDKELGVFLPSSVWRAILVFLRGLLVRYPEDSDTYRQLYASVSLLERRIIDQTRASGTRKDDYPLFATCPYVKEYMGECRQAESCELCSLRSEVENP